MNFLFLKLICYVRKITSPLIWNVVKRFLKRPPEDYWLKIKQQPLSVFNSMMSAVDYKIDPLWGIIDYTYHDPAYYFYTANEYSVFFGADCDDSSFVWFEYLKGRSYVTDVYMILGMNGCNITRSHFWTVARFEDGKYRIFNYVMYPKAFDSLEEACYEFKSEAMLKSGRYDKLNWLIYSSWKKDAI